MSWTILPIEEVREPESENIIYPKLTSVHGAKSEVIKNKVAVAYFVTEENEDGSKSYSVRYNRSKVLNPCLFDKWLGDAVDVCSFGVEDMDTSSTLPNFLDADMKLLVVNDLPTIVFRFSTGYNQTAIDQTTRNIQYWITQADDRGRVGKSWSECYLITEVEDIVDQKELSWDAVKISKNDGSPEEVGLVYGSYSTIEVFSIKVEALVRLIKYQYTNRRYDSWNDASEVLALSVFKNNPNIVSDDPVWTLQQATYPSVMIPLKLISYGGKPALFLPIKDYVATYEGADQEYIPQHQDTFLLQPHDDGSLWNDVSDEIYDGDDLTSRTNKYRMYHNGSFQDVSFPSTQEDFTAGSQTTTYQSPIVPDPTSESNFTFIDFGLVVDAYQDETTDKLVWATKVDQQISFFESEIPSGTYVQSDARLAYGLEPLPVGDTANITHNYDSQGKLQLYTLSRPFLARTPVLSLNEYDDDSCMNPKRMEDIPATDDAGDGEMCQSANSFSYAKLHRIIDTELIILEQACNESSVRSFSRIGVLCNTVVPTPVIDPVLRERITDTDDPLDELQIPADWCKPRIIYCEPKSVIQGAINEGIAAQLKGKCFSIYNKKELGQPQEKVVLETSIEINPVMDSPVEYILPFKRFNACDKEIEMATCKMITTIKSKTVIDHPYNEPTVADTPIEPDPCTEDSLDQPVTYQTKSAFNDTVRIHWKQVVGAGSYEIARDEEENVIATEVCSTYYDDEINDGKIHQYYVRSMP